MWSLRCLRLRWHFIRFYHIQISFSLDSHNLASGRMLHDFCKAAGWLLHSKCCEFLWASKTHYRPTTFFIIHHLVSLTTNNRLQFYGRNQSAIISFFFLARHLFSFHSNDDNIIKVETTKHMKVDALFFDIIYFSLASSSDHQ